jgi:hypothetical protein
MTAEFQIELEIAAGRCLKPRRLHGLILPWPGAALIGRNGDRRGDDETKSDSRRRPDFRFICGSWTKAEQKETRHGKRRYAASGLFYDYFSYI